MIAKIYGPSRQTKGLVLQHVVYDPEVAAGWLGMVAGDEVIYQDRATGTPGSELETITGHVSQKIVRIVGDITEVTIILRNDMIDKGSGHV